MSWRGRRDNAAVAVELGVAKRVTESEAAEDETPNELAATKKAATKKAATKKAATKKAATKKAGAGGSAAAERPGGHTGSWRYHDDDCMCGAYGGYCNRNGYTWSCCGACKRDSICSLNQRHATHWSDPRFPATHDAYGPNGWPVYRSNAEIAALDPAPGSEDPPHEETSEPK